MSGCRLNGRLAYCKVCILCWRELDYSIRDQFFQAVFHSISDNLKFGITKKTSNVTPHRFLLLLYRVLKTIQVQHRAWHSDIFGLETRSETRLPNLSTKYVSTWLPLPWAKRKQTKRVLRKMYYSPQSKDKARLQQKQKFSQIQLLEILYVIVDTRQNQKNPSFFLASSVGPQAQFSPSAIAECSAMTNFGLWPQAVAEAVG